MQKITEVFTFAQDEQPSANCGPSFDALSKEEICKAFGVPMQMLIPEAHSAFVERHRYTMEAFAALPPHVHANALTLAHAQEQLDAARNTGSDLAYCRDVVLKPVRA